MLNKEKYAKEIIEIAANGCSVAKVKGKLCCCDRDMNCSLCDFNYKIMSGKTCREKIRDWMNEEYDPGKQSGEEDKVGLTPGTHFTFKNYEWIVLDNNVDGGVLAIMASAWNNEEYSFDDDDCNDYAKSSLREKLRNELLPVLGEDNLITHEVDLVADNGDARYGRISDKVFILSRDEYRKYRKHVPLLPKWMWTCTPWYITNTGNGHYVRGVYVSGYLDSHYVSNSGGVAPACVLNTEKLNLIHNIELTEKSTTNR